MRHLLLCAVAFLVLCVDAFPADSEKVLDCISRVERSSWSGRASREVIAAIACRGAGSPVEGGPSLTLGDDFEERVETIGECVREVSFWLRESGQQAELVAANACVGTTDAEVTAECVREVSRSYRHVRDAAAESLAAQACARGNHADETTECIEEVSFHLSASGALGEILATYACSR